MSDRFGLGFVRRHSWIHLTPPFVSFFSEASGPLSLSTGKERDTETGNDYFGARYYASSVGRWLSPDWSAKHEPVPYSKMTDPQTLNLYGYVQNNPLSRVDADGHGVWDLAKSWLNVIEVKATAALGSTGSYQLGQAKGEYKASWIGGQVKTGLGGEGFGAKAVCGLEASATAGPVKAKAELGAELSSEDGASAKASVSAQAGSASVSAEAKVDDTGAHARMTGGLNGPKADEDFKIGASFALGIGFGSSVNFSQAGRAWDETKKDFKAIGSYLNNALPSGPIPIPSAPIIPNQ